MTQINNPPMTPNEFRPPSMDSLFRNFLFGILLISGCILWMMTYTVNNYSQFYPRKMKEMTASSDASGASHQNYRLHREDQPYKIILFWNNFGTIQPYEFGLGHEPFYKHRCTIHECMTTENRTLLSEADVVIFHVRGLEDESKESLPKHQHPKQLFVFFTLESPIHTYHDLTKFNDYFNLTFTYRDDSDIQCPMGKITNRPSSRTIRNMDKRLKKIYSTKTKMAAWVISKCDKEGSMRWQYGQELAKHINLDIYGECGTLNCPKSNFGIKCYTLISRKYHFYLGFENSYCKDYTTEKLWRTLQYNLVPVVLGGTNYSRFLPEKSFINVKDFKSPKYLGQYLHHLIDNPAEYMDYFRWKETLRLRTVTNLRRDGFCKLCEMLYMPEKFTFKNNFDAHKWWDMEGECLEGEELAITLGLPPGTIGP